MFPHVGVSHLSYKNKIKMAIVYGNTGNVYQKNTLL